MNYGKRIKLTFDSPVYHVSNAELTRWAIKNAYGEMLYPVAITYGPTQNVVNLDFSNFNNLVEPGTMECFGCVAMGSHDMPLDAFSSPFYPINLWPVPCDFEYLALSSVEVEGELKVAFDGKTYADEYLKLNSITIEGDQVLLSFSQRYSDEHLQLSSIAIEGQYCDINGVPL